MKNTIKKNQVIIFTIALMLIAAGYMNYTANTEDTLKIAAASDSEKYADLGDAKLVSTNITENVIEANDENDINNNTSENVMVNEECDSIQTANGTSTINQYFTQSKLDRDTMYSEMIDSYQKILNNTQISETQKTVAQQEITNINNKKNAIMIAENLIKNKGFENVLIFINDKSVNVVVKATNLEQEKIAQIQNIVQREIGVEIEDIHITNKV